MKASSIVRSAFNIKSTYNTTTGSAAHRSTCHLFNTWPSIKPQFQITLTRKSLSLQTGLILLTALRLNASFMTFCTANTGRRLRSLNRTGVREREREFIIIILLILFITFVQGRYNYTPETSHVSRVYTVQLFCSYSICHMQCYYPP